MFAIELTEVYTDVYKGEYSAEKIARCLAQSKNMIDAVCDTALLNESTELWYQLAVCAQADHIADTGGSLTGTGASADGRLSRVTLGDYSCTYTYTGSSSSGAGAAPSAVCRKGGYISLGALAFLDKGGLICRAVDVE